MANWAALAGGNTPAVDLQNAALNAFNALNAVPAVNLGGLGNINLLRPILEHVETIEAAYLDAEQAYKSEDWAAAHAALTRMNVAATALQGNGTVGAGNTAVAATACRAALNNAITNDASDTATSCFTARNAGLQQATATNFANDVLLTARATLAALATPAATLEAAKAERAHDKIAAAVGRATVAQGIFNAQVAGNATLGQLATTADTITHELGQVLDEAKALLALPGLAGQAAQQAALQGTVDYLDKLVHGGDGDRMTQSRTLSQAELVNAARALTNPALGTYPKAMVAEMLEARVAIHNPANKYYLQPEQLMQVVEPLLVSGTDANLGASATPVVHRLLHQALDAKQLIALSKEALEQPSTRTNNETIALHNALLSLISQRIGTEEMRPSGAPQAGTPNERIDMLRPWLDNLHNVSRGNQHQIGGVVEALITQADPPGATQAQQLELQGKRDELYAWCKDNRYMPLPPGAPPNAPRVAKLLPELATRILVPYAAGFDTRNP